MKLVIGLGNPGSEYAATRHNAGFIALDTFAASHAATFSEDASHRAEIAKATVGGETVILAKPTTFMNLSGEAAQSIASYYKIPQSDVLIVQDEMDFAPGVFAFSRGGGTAGHNGIASIYEHLGGNADVARLRVGVGRPQDQTPADKHVLQHIDTPTVDRMADIARAIETWIAEGLDRAMNTWNTK